MILAHFSDLHILDLEGVGPLRFLNKRLSGYANLRFKRSHAHRSAYVRAVAREIRRRNVDHVAITGDLTNLALETEFAAVDRLLDEELGLSPDQVSVVPGNHDLYTRGSMTSRRFATTFARYLVSDLPELAIDLPAGPYPCVKLREGAAIIGLSSAVPRPPMVAAGVLGAPQLAALARVLAHPEVKKRTPVILLHHPAHNPPSRVKAMVEGLHDAALLWTALEELPEGLVLHGHLHRRVERALPTRRGSLRAVGATSASLEHELEARMAGFNLYEIDAQGIRAVTSEVYDAARDDFRPVAIPVA
jgi:3',5'-cyclic AMP phosphodiesterase CpdA